MNNHELKYLSLLINVRLPLLVALMLKPHLMKVEQILCQTCRDTSINKWIINSAHRTPFSCSRTKSGRCNRCKQLHMHTVCNSNNTCRIMELLQYSSIRCYLPTTDICNLLSWMYPPIRWSSNNYMQQIDRIALITIISNLPKFSNINFTRRCKHCRKRVLHARIWQIKYSYQELLLGNISILLNTNRDSTHRKIIQTK